MTPLRLCFDARMVYASGIGTYIRGILSALSFQSLGTSSVTLLTRRQDRLNGSWSTIPVNAPIYSLQEQVMVPWAFRRSDAQLLHVPHYNVPAARISDCVVTVHDLIHLKFPEFLPSRLALGYAKFFFHTLIPRARALITVSENTKRDMIEMLGIPAAKITVTPLGVPDGFHSQKPESYLPRLNQLGLKPGYFLFVGNLKPFKNVQRLLQAYTLLKQKYPHVPPLVFVGKNFIPGFDQDLKKSADVQWLSEVEQTALPAIYAGALVLVFPSLYEGFGLPPLEAMACGTPVICSNRGSLPEVVGDAALQIDPLQVDAIAAAMYRVYQDLTFVRSLSEKGLQRATRFSWRNTAEKTLDVYKACLA